MNRTNKISLLLIFIFICLPTTSLIAQNKDLSFSIGTVRTEAEAAAIRYLIEYTKNLHSLLLMSKEFEGNWLLELSPEVKLETGEKDAFNGLIAKVNGNFILFDTVQVAGIPTINTAKYFSVIPLSLGIETNRRFDNVNALAEVGYIPWYQNDKSISKILKKSKIGIFLQGGYKVKVDSMESINNEKEIGNTDQGKEDPNSTLARIKATAVFNPQIMIGSDFGLGAIGAANTWFDLINSEFYYRIEATFRIILTTGQFFDFSYQKGSGAPNFNTGDQFSANIVITF